eukprot:TRINITY_DN2891_c0_g1_i1.p3 TRINITY_DN2891_c0_g1~~TRINITY_DN2891_c0_g1_i1.p3  ORF type:complete len:134 (+),score=11.64 TRINITY_DN2891_c0_g1_i1:761-1162(+)
MREREREKTKKKKKRKARKHQEKKNNQGKKKKRIKTNKQKNPEGQHTQKKEREKEKAKTRKEQYDQFSPLPTFSSLNRPRHKGRDKKKTHEREKREPPGGLCASMHAHTPARGAGGPTLPATIRRLRGLPASR